MPLDSHLLKEFMSDFLGYGNLGSPIWFIGMEEGGGNSLEEIQARLSAWDKRWRRHTEDLHDFCQATGHPALMPYATAEAPYNRTWGSLIKHLHQLQNLPLASAVEYQRTKWLTRGEDNCLLNFMPLPSPNTDTWHYSSWSDLPELRTREGYLKTLAPTRIKRLRYVIENFKPQTVVCFGTSYRPYWEQLREGMTETTFEIIPHPAARTSTNSSVSATVPGTPPADHGDKLTRFFESGKRFIQLGSIGQHPVFIGYAQGDRLCLELKEVNAPALRARIEQKQALLGKELGQSVRWQPTGKTKTGSGILALYYEDRADIGEGEEQWAQRLCPLFFQITRQLAEE